MCSHRSQQQIDSTAAVLRASDTTIIKDRLAAMEQNILNLQLQFHEMVTNHEELRCQALRDHQQMQEILRQLQQVHPPTTSPSDEFATDLP